MVPGAGESGSAVEQRHAPSDGSSRSVEQQHPSVEQVAQRPSSRPRARARALAVVIFLVGLVAVALVLLNPDANPTTNLVARVSEWLESRNAPSSVSDEETVERVANAMLFFPFGLVGMLAWRKGVLWWTGAGFLVSLAAELAQQEFLPERTPSAADVVINTAGACAGAFVGAALLAVWSAGAWLVRRRRSSRSRA
jgi:VanZ family protein